ncbi:hypothetical protein KC959_00990 [Candidatus Saccharibacteria bacterium]|nr:hypothetical protein [Candidatus Saccharibacteria bacterium]
MFLSTDLCELRAEAVTPASASFGVAIELYKQERLKDESDAKVIEQISGLETSVYYDEDDTPVAVSSVDTSYSHLGEYTLELLAVDTSNRGLGIGRTVLASILLNYREEYEDGILIILAQPSTTDYYLDLGARNEDGLIYFELSDESIF